MKPLISIVLAITLLSSSAVVPQSKVDLAAEKRVVDYLKENVKPGQPLIVSDLYNNVFKNPEERKVIDRLFNIFFKVPLFVAQYKAAMNQPPTLADIARQFNLPIPGEADVLLSIIDNDPRVPKFIKRDPKSGEIVDVDIEAVKKDRRFGQVIERTLMGWPGKNAPPFTLDLFGGGTLDSTKLAGKSYLVYFWFSGCPPCMKIAPHLTELQKRFDAGKFTVVAVNADRFLELGTTDDERAAYVSKVGFQFPVAHLNKQMQEEYGNVNVYPTLFLVDSQGVIRKNYIGYQTLQTLEIDVEDLLKGAPAGTSQR